jgi:glucose-1-phosphate thymidylyltransferase
MRPKPAAAYLLERMRSAGVTKAFIVLRQGKWDIPAFLGDGSTFGMSFAYLMMNSPLGPPYTLDQGYPFLKNATVAFGFPDIIFKTADPFSKLLARQRAKKAQVVLGLFPARTPHQVDMVTTEPNGRVRSIQIKPRRTRSRHTWIVAVWSPVFSRFMHEHLDSPARRGRDSSSVETSVGHVFQAALRAGLHFDSVVFGEKSWIDIGTAADLAQATRRFL